MVDGVVPERDVLRRVAENGEPAVGGMVGQVVRGADVVDQVVLDRDVLGLQRRVDVVPARDVEHRGEVPDDVAPNGDVPRHRPRRAAALIARREQDGVARLTRRPVVLDGVAFDQDILGVLELEQVLDRPALRHPRERPADQVAAHRDVRRHQVRNARIAAAEHHVLAGGLEVVVLDQIRAGSVPAHDRLGVLLDALEVREVRVEDLGVAAVEREPAPLAIARVAVEIAAIDHQVLRHRRERALGRACAAEFDEVGAAGRRAGQKLEKLQRPIGRARIRPHRRPRRRRANLGEQRRRRRRDALSRGRQHAVRARGSDGDRRRAVLHPQPERAVEGGARLQHDGVPGVGGVDRRLEITARIDRQRGRRHGRGGREHRCKAQLHRKQSFQERHSCLGGTSGDRTRRKMVASVLASRFRPVF